MITPRPYQKRAIDAAVSWMRKNTESCVLDLSMSAGKSIIAAFIANEMHKISGGKKSTCSLSKCNACVSKCGKVRNDQR